MEHDDLIVRTPGKGVHLTRTIWIVIASVAALVVAALLLTLYRYPQYSQLLILFLYTVPSEFLIAVIPHEPIIFYYSKLFHPFTVTWVTLLGTLFAEYLNYVLIDQLFRIPKMSDLRNHRYFQKFNNYFMRAPFASLVVAALTPIPFYPFRIFASASKYSLRKYLLAIFVGRTPRFYVLAHFGYMIKIPNWLIIVLFVVLFLSSIIIRRRKKKKEDSQSLN